MKVLQLAYIDDLAYLILSDTYFFIRAAHLEDDMKNIKEVLLEVVEEQKRINEKLLFISTISPADKY